MPDTPQGPTATLIISSSYSKCAGCGSQTNPHTPTHARVTGYGVNGFVKGCGARFTAVTTDQAGPTDYWRAILADMRPDLPIVEYGTTFADTDGSA